MPKKPLDNLEGIRIEFQDSERELLEGFLFSYRMQALGPVMNILKDPLEVFGIAVSISCVLEYLGPKFGYNIETGIPCPSEWKDIIQGAKDSYAQAVADQDLPADQRSDRDNVGPKIMEGEWLGALGSAVGNILNPNWSIQKPFSDDVWVDDPDWNPFTFKTVRSTEKVAS